MWQLIHDAWWRLATTTQPRSLPDSLLSGVLQGGACVYQSGVAARNQAYDRGWCRPVRLSCPVISVGNVTVGGTGKTICVELLASKLQQLGLRVVVLSRGYGGHRPGPYTLTRQAGQLCVDGAPVAQQNGLADEPQLLAMHLNGVPVVVGARREHTGRYACASLGADVLLLDDGFQHRQLYRDCDVVLVQARMPLGGWPLFPRGPMREPLSALQRAQIMIITKVDQSLEVSAALQERLKAINPEAVIATAMHEPVDLWDPFSDTTLPLQQLERRRVSLVSSIGDPEGFEQGIRRLGAVVASHHAFPDHHAYTAQEWAAVLAKASSAQAEAVVTTEKDVMRVRPVWRQDAGASVVPVWVLRVRMRLLSGEALLDARLAAVHTR